VIEKEEEKARGPEKGTRGFRETGEIIKWEEIA
jgi:hypothetical protein